ncbi:unnamed protein product [Rotaria sp. Silwood2]|nr:unnamed protein product [Rotaria sp. Silwood2]
MLFHRFIKKSLSSLWQTISELSRTAINTTVNLLDQFINFSLINSITLPEELLKTKTEASLDLLRQISSATLVRPLTLVNRMAQANEFVTALPTNSIAVTEHFDPWRRNPKVRFLDINQTNLEKLNIFSNQSPDSIRIRHGRIASRLYLILLIVFICVLIVYTSISVQTIIKTVKPPTSEEYKKIFAQSSQTLQCPCTVALIPFEEVLQVIPHYHQICSSDLIQPW